MIHPRTSRTSSERDLREFGFHFDLPEIEEVGVFAVDDDGMSLRLIEAFLKRIGHPVRVFSSARDALVAIRADPPQILVTDMVMPEMSGVDLAHEAKAADPDIQVVLVTGYGDKQTAEATTGLGVSSYLTKPIGLEELHRVVLRAFVGRAVAERDREVVNWLYESMARNADEIRSVTLGTLTSLINAMDARTPHFRGHSQAVALQAAATAQELGLNDDEVESIRTAGLLHDIGMIGVSDAIIDKRDALTPDEVAVIRGHCQAGAAIIEPMKHLGPSTRYVLEHHERWDGSGYPDGKKGEEISLGGQIVGIAEAWTGIIEDRAYREGRSREEGMEILLKQQGKSFTEEVTQALIVSDVGVIG